MRNRAREHEDAERIARHYRRPQPPTTVAATEAALASSIGLAEAAAAAAEAARQTAEDERQATRTALADKPNKEAVK